MLLTLFFTPNSHCYLRRIQKWGKSWPCHNWNKWLICQILPNYPTGIWSSKSVPTFIVNFPAKDTAFKREIKHFEADALLIWCFMQNIEYFLAEIWVLNFENIPCSSFFVAQYFNLRSELAATRKWGGDHLRRAAAFKSSGRSSFLTPTWFEASQVFGKSGFEWVWGRPSYVLSPATCW